jgi:hypothetical protein
MGKNLDVSFSNDSLNIILKAQATKPKINN